MLRLFAHEGTKARGAQKQGLALVVRPGVRRVACRLSKSFGPKSLAGTGYPRNEPASRSDAAPQYNPPTRHDENPIRRSATLIDYETRGPGCACRVRNQRLTLGFSEPRRPKIR